MPCRRSGPSSRSMTRGGSPTRSRQTNWPWHDLPALPRRPPVAARNRRRGDAPTRRRPRPCRPRDRSRNRAVVVARKAGTMAGLPLVEAALLKLDPKAAITAHHRDGDAVAAKAALLTIDGDARAVLSAERVALNFLGHLSGVATAAASFVKLIAHTNARVCCTRKTTPGLRALEKYAVPCGGGFNHRFGLDDAILIKDNHIAVAGGIAAVLKRSKAVAGHLVKIEIEVDTL